MEEWKKQLENRNKSDVDILIENNKNLVEKISISDDKELILSSYWQIRKNYEKMKHLYSGLLKFVSKTYNDDYIEAFYNEIHYYEKLLQNWRIFYPENNIRYDYYIELAEIEYSFFIKNKLSMPKELREEIFHYHYKEVEKDQVNISIILNNLKLAQKILEINALQNHLKKEHDELFIIYDVIGNLLICIHELINLNRDNITTELDSLIIQSYINFMLSYESKLVNEEPTVYREGIVNMPYIDLFNKFFNKEDFVSYHSVEKKIEFLKNNYSELLQNTFITKKLEEIEDKGRLLLEKKIEVELNLKSIGELESEEKKSYDNLIKVRLEKEIFEKCNLLASIVPIYQNKAIIPTDIALYIEQFEENEIKLNFLNVVIDRVIYIKKEQMEDYLLKLISQVAPKTKHKVKLVVFKSGFQESGNMWTYFTKFYLDQKYEVITVAKLIEDIRNLNVEDERYYIFMDDVVGTGDQFIRTFKNELSITLEDFIDMRENLPKTHFKLIAGVGSWESKKKISETLKVLSESDILFEKTIHPKDKAFNEDFWNADFLKKTLNFLKKKDNQFWQGYGQSEYLVILEWNVPNNTIGCLWHNPNGWKPLFPRM